MLVGAFRYYIFETMHKMSTWKGVRYDTLKMGCVCDCWKGGTQNTVIYLLCFILLDYFPSTYFCLTYILLTQAHYYHHINLYVLFYLTTYWDCTTLASACHTYNLSMLDYFILLDCLLGLPNTCFCLICLLLIHAWLFHCDWLLTPTWCAYFTHIVLTVFDLLNFEISK